MPNNMSGYATVKVNLESKVNSVRKWMIENHLKMNDLKMEFMVFGSRYNLDKHTVPSLKVRDSDIINNKNIKFLAVILALHLTFKGHISNKSEIALYNLPLICKIRNFLTTDQLIMPMFSCTHSLRLLQCQYL